MREPKGANTRADRARQNRLEWVAKNIEDAARSLAEVAPTVVDLHRQLKGLAAAVRLHGGSSGASSAGSQPTTAKESGAGKAATCATQDRREVER